MGPNYEDPSNLVTPSEAGRDLQIGAAYRATETFTLSAHYALKSPYSTGRLSQSYSLEAKSKFGLLEASLGIAGTLGADTTDTALSGPDNLWVTAGVAVPLGQFTLGAVQRIGLGSTFGETVLGVDYAISQNFGIRVENILTYVNGLSAVDWRGSISARGTFTNAEILRTLNGNYPAIPDTFGTTNIAATYDLPGADGRAGRFRVGLDTTLPLSAALFAQAGLEVALESPGANTTASTSLGLLYAEESSKASARAQFSISPAGLKQVYSLGGIFGVSEALIFSPVAEYAREADGRDGTRFSLAAAYRGDDWTLLTNNNARFGYVFAGAPGRSRFEGEVQLAYTPSEFLFLRGGVAYQLEDVFTGQLSTGATWFVTDLIGLGGNLSYLFQPATASSRFLFGLEGNLRFAPGLLLAAGFNWEVAGIGGPINYLNNNPGFYLRLDWKFDERTFGLNR